MSNVDVQSVLAILKPWSELAVEKFEVAAVYGFGSLTNKNGDQFGESSDIDLVIRMPQLDNALARYRWLQSFLEHKNDLELKLFQALHRHGQEPIVSVLAVTDVEIQYDLHKDGHRQFFSQNRYRDLISGLETIGLEGCALSQSDRFVAAALSFVQKTRNVFFAVSANRTQRLMPFTGEDPLPKSIMRAAAMAARARDESLEAGAEYDVQEGLDLLTDYLYRARRTDPGLKRLQDILSVRRGARGAGGAIEVGDQLLLAEIIYDLTLEQRSRSTNIEQPTHSAGKAELEAQVDPPGARSSPDGAETEHKQGLPSLNGDSSTKLFAMRFASAFPGVRKITWYDNQDAIRMRLERLLEQPLVYSDGVPIWWWRGRNLQIEKFYHLRDNIYLMNYEELAISRIAAVPSQHYKRMFVYVETSAMQPIGLYKVDTEASSARVSEVGYDDEEYGLYKGEIPITRGEYDDGSALIEGKLVKVSGETELRARYTTNYNFVIAAQESPINNPRFDEKLETSLNKLLRDRRDEIIEELAEEVRVLPARGFGLSA